MRVYHGPHRDLDVRALEAENKWLREALMMLAPTLEFAFKHQGLTARDCEHLYVLVKKSVEARNEQSAVEGRGAP